MFYRNIIWSIVLIVTIPSCEKRDWNNPFDPDCSKESFTPSNFKAEQQGNLVKLSWSQVNTHISGFKIERKVADGAWEKVASLSKSIITWNEDKLIGGKLYEYRLNAYAGNNLSNKVTTQITPLFVATITTSAISNVTSSSASSGGTISSDGGAPVTARGVCWGTSQNPTITGSKTTDGTGTGSFTSAFTGLTAGSTYYVRAYATNSVGTTYGSQINFTTGLVLSLATVTTSSVSTYTSTTALLGGTVTNDGNATVTERGVCYSTSQNPTTAYNKTTLGSGTGVFSTTISGLTASTTYYVRAYAVNSQGTAYGNQISFTTNSIPTLPTVTTNSVTIYTSTTALLGGNVTSDGNATVTDRGVCYSTSQNPTTANNKTVIGSGTGTFSTTLTGLRANTTYYVRAYATNIAGTGYGSEVDFTTVSSFIVTDADGNIYNTVVIGTQIWMASDLKTTKYNDNTAIPLVTDHSLWGNLTTPGYCWFNNDEITYKNTYGALYNWFAVNTGKLCPVGWHVPNGDPQSSSSDWEVLENYLGGWSIAGGKLKESGTAHWISPNIDATNESGFTALPSGGRGFNGTFGNYIGIVGHWWSTTETSSTPTHAWNRFMQNEYSFIVANGQDKRIGYSVRCIKD